MVLIIKNGLRPEECWVRISDLSDRRVMGTLLNEPDQDFGYHAGDTIAFLFVTMRKAISALFPI